MADFVQKHVALFKNFLLRQDNMASINVASRSGRSRVYPMVNSKENWGECPPQQISPLALEKSLALKCQWEGLDYINKPTKTPWEINLEEKLDKILGIEDKDHMITPFAWEINKAELARRLTWAVIIVLLIPKYFCQNLSTLCLMVNTCQRTCVRCFLNI